MKSVYCTLGLFLILCITFVKAHPQSTEGFIYSRIDEVKRECSSILPPDFDQKPSGNRLYRLPEKLSFLNGDWWQDLDKHPLIPYDDKPTGLSDQSSPLNLISFWNMDRDGAHRSNNSVSVSGVLQLGIMRGELLETAPSGQHPKFIIDPGHSELGMVFQGIATYTEENEGEIVMCLLGHAVLPSRYPDSDNPWDWVKEPGYINQPPRILDDRILLVIRYPEKLTIKKRGLYGSLKSLNQKSSQKYFDEIHISASTSCSATYEFSSEKLVSKACTPPPGKADLGTVKGADFCRILKRFWGENFLSVVPNWKCNGTNEFCSKLGPFESGASIKATNGSFKGVTLHIQEVRCEKPSSEGKDGGLAKVAMVIRVVSPSDDTYTVPQRTGLNNMMLSAEGVWDPSIGQLCMVGCLGIADEEGDGCDSRIQLYIPLSFSIKQRSIILGSIASIEESNMSYFPLAFEKRVHYEDLLPNQYYEYSKIDLARSVLEKHEGFSIETVIKKTFLTFPKVKHAKSFDSFLAEDLRLQHPVVCESAPGCSPSESSVHLKILSLGQLSLQKDSIIGEDTHLNVSAQLSLSRAQNGNFSEVFVEGIYHPLVGKMYLVGCRDVRASYSNLLYESTDLEDGFDCLIEIVVSYPPIPTTTWSQWLAYPTARISIASQRNKLDPLFFTPIKLQTVQLMYETEHEDISSRRGVAGILQVLTHLIAIGCILSQLFYIKENLDSVHYVSLIMVAIQALGYGFPLITGVSLVKSNGSSSDYTNYQMIQAINTLVLILLLLTLRLYQKVWRSRIRLLSRAHHVPSDRRVLLVTFFIHVFGFGCFLMVHKLQSWVVELNEYLVLVQDFFLLPQVIGNLIWQIDRKPLRKSYFVGLTVIQILPYVYDYKSSAILYPSSEEIEPSYLNLYSKRGAIGIPTIAIFLALIVHAQQKWSYKNLGRIFTFEWFRILPRGSMAYEQLPSVEADAELNSGFKGFMKTLQRRRGWK